MISVSLPASSLSSAGSRYTTGSDIQLFCRHTKQEVQIHQWCVFVGLVSVYLCIFVTWISAPSIVSNISTFLSVLDGFCKSNLRLYRQGEEQRDIKDTVNRYHTNAEQVCEGKHFETATHEAWYPPALLSLELVGSAKNVAESTPWSQVQEALCLRRKDHYCCFFCMFVDFKTCHLILFPCNKYNHGN